MVLDLLTPIPRRQGSASSCRLIGWGRGAGDRGAASGFLLRPESALDLLRTPCWVAPQGEDWEAPPAGPWLEETWSLGVQEVGASGDLSTQIQQDCGSHL